MVPTMQSGTLSHQEPSRVCAQTDHCVFLRRSMGSIALSLAAPSCQSKSRQPTRCMLRASILPQCSQLANDPNAPPGGHKFGEGDGGGGGERVASDSDEVGGASAMHTFVHTTGALARASSITAELTHTHLCCQELDDIMNRFMNDS